MSLLAAPGARRCFESRPSAPRRQHKSCAVAAGARRRGACPFAEEPQCSRPRRTRRMPRPLSKVAPDWWDYTTLDEKILQDAARLTEKDLLKLSRPGFRV